MTILKTIDAKPTAEELRKSAEIGRLINGDTISWETEHALAEIDENIRQAAMMAPYIFVGSHRPVAGQSLVGSYNL